ncbi:MAG: hypothetical protein ACPG8O_09115, partial [Alcanivorax nanhaiticus]
RSLANAERNACLLDLPGATADTLALFEADLLDEFAFDECVAGAQCVFHTASPFVTSNIIGATNLEQLEENLKSVELPWDKEQEKALEAIHTRFPYPAP